MKTKPENYDDMFDDMQHLLGWLGIGLFVVGVLQTIYAVTAMTEGRWIIGSLHAAAALVFYGSWLRTEFRASSYRLALRIQEKRRRAREDQAAMSIRVEGEQPLPADWVKALDAVSRRGKGRRS